MASVVVVLTAVPPIWIVTGLPIPKPLPVSVTWAPIAALVGETVMALVVVKLAVAEKASSLAVIV